MVFFHPDHLSESEFKSQTAWKLSCIFPIFCWLDINFFFVFSLSPSSFLFLYLSAVFGWWKTFLSFRLLKEYKSFVGGTELTLSLVHKQKPELTCLNSGCLMFATHCEEGIEWNGMKVERWMKCHIAKDNAKYDKNYLCIA